MWHDPEQKTDAPETEASGAVRPACAKEAAFAEVARLTDAIVRHTRASQELAAESLVEKARADAAAVRRSFVMAEAIEAAGHSTSTHTLTCDRGKVEVIPIPQTPPVEWKG